jgi:hypothetical protein
VEDVTHPRTRELPRLTPPAHEHGWTVESRHATLDGLVLYVRCAACGTRRVDVSPAPWVPATALSRDVEG